MNTKLIRSFALPLQKYFEGEVKEMSMEALKDWLIAEIVKMLMHDMEKLLNILYRIDVNERKVKEAFAQSDPKRIAPELARLIIEREMQKAETRLKYRDKEE